MPHARQVGAVSKLRRKPFCANNARMRVIVGVFHEYGTRTTVHGLSHMYQSPDFRRRMFWFFLTVVSIVACIIHIYFIVANYMETPVNSVILNGAVRQEFPDITFCNMKPISESAQFHGRAEIDHLFKKDWNNFEDWFSKNTTYKTIEMFKKYRTFMEVFWASEDTRDLGHDDDVVIVYCKYKGKPCNASAFKLVQNLQYWNCYSFRPEEMGEDRDVYSGSYEEGLSLILYTNSILLDVHPLSELHRIASDVNYKVDVNVSKFIEYLSKSNLSLNQLLYGDRLEPGGMRIILHEKGSYPYVFKNSFVVGNGDSAVIEFDMTTKETIDRAESPCRSEESVAADQVKYMTFYPGKDKLGKNFMNYKTSRLDYIIERTQELFFKKCGCYTHQMPFNVFNSKLCYFCNNGTDKTAIDKTLRDITCHDLVYEKEFKTRVLDFYKKAEAFQPCKVKDYDAKMSTSRWPRQDDITYLIDEFLIPAFLEQSFGGNFYNHILRKTKIFPLKDIVKIKTTNDTTFWETNEFLVRNSLLKVTIHASQPTGALHQEVESYSFAEALSEIGGIFGLYAGLSILTFFEFIELFYVMATTPKEIANLKDKGKSKFSMIKGAMTPSELKAYDGSHHQDGCSGGPILSISDLDFCDETNGNRNGLRYSDYLLRAEEAERRGSVERPLAFTSYSSPRV